MTGIRLIWGAPTAAAAYRADLLTEAERERAGRRVGARSAREWAVSRALLQQPEVATAIAAGAAWSLSHSSEHALVAVAPPGVSLGVDLEWCRPRAIERLAEWVCTKAELLALLRLPERGRQRHFYRLWTVKEAVLKAAGLDFPSAMHQVEIDIAAATLVVATPGCWTALVQEWEQWTAAVVWNGSQQHPVVWSGGPATPAPLVREGLWLGGAAAGTQAWGSRSEL